VAVRSLDEDDTVPHLDDAGPVSHGAVGALGPAVVGDDPAAPAFLERGTVSLVNVGDGGHAAR